MYTYKYIYANNLKTEGERAGEWKAVRGIHVCVVIGEHVLQTVVALVRVLAASPK